MISVGTAVALAAGFVICIILTVLMCYYTHRKSEPVCHALQTLPRTPSNPSNPRPNRSNLIPYDETLHASYRINDSFLPADFRQIRRWAVGNGYPQTAIHVGTVAEVDDFTRTVYLFHSVNVDEDRVPRSQVEELNLRTASDWGLTPLPDRRPWQPVMELPVPVVPGGQQACQPTTRPEPAEETPTEAPKPAVKTPTNIPKPARVSRFIEHHDEPIATPAQLKEFLG